MVGGNKPYIRRELEFLMQEPNWRNRWAEAIKEHEVGQPQPFVSYRQSSGTLIHHAFTLCRFETLVRRQISDYSCIVEFGGGYGSLCRLISRLGFKGRYIIYDLPEFSALQRFFLPQVGVPVHSCENDQREGTYLTSSLESLRKLLPNNRAGSLLIALWSISEIPIELREEFLATIGQCEAYLFAYQTGFSQINNVAYFRLYRSLQPTIQWYDVPLSHLPGNHYLIGQQKS